MYAGTTANYKLQIYIEMTNEVKVLFSYTGFTLVYKQSKQWYNSIKIKIADKTIQIIAHKLIKWQRHCLNDTLK